MSSTTTYNPALTDEIEAIRAIFDEDTIQIVSSDSSTTTFHLKPPAQPFTFTLSFPTNYPDVPPSVDGTASTGNTSKGAGDHAVKLLVEILGTVYQPGAVCLFELISDAGPLLEEESNTNSDGNNSVHTTTPPASNKEDPKEPHRSAQPTSTSPSPSRTSTHESATLTPSPPDPTTTHPPPQWTTSTPLTLQKSTFLAHAAPCTTRLEALSHMSSLISSSKKLATATHNITAYRIRLRQPQAVGSNTTSSSLSPSYIQDSNDDGESAAGGRLLHLLQLMECEDVVVVVTRWYGGVKLGGERFRCIGNVAREVLVKGGWGKGTEKQKDGSTTRGKKK
jgi:hypothetical protein